MPPRTIGKLLLLSTLALGPAAWLRADPPDSLLQELERREKVAAQRMEKIIEKALAEADKQKADPARVLEILRQALAQLEGDPKQGIEGDKALSIARRASLQATLRERIKKTELAAAEKPASDEARQAAEARREIERAALQRRAEQLKEDLKAIEALKQQGKLGEAARVADQAARQNPNQPSAQQARGQLSMAQAVRQSEQLTAERALASAAAINDVFRSAIPIQGDIAYPADWAQKSAKRLAKYQQGATPLSDKEKAILRSLNEATASPVQFRETSLEQVLAFLEKEIGHPLVLNKSSMEELKIGYESPLTVSLPKGVAKRTLLRRVLSELGLTYVVKNETIEVMSILRAQSEMVVRYYQIDDLLGGAAANPLLGAPGALGAGAGIGVGAPDPMRQVDAIIDMIQNSVDPASWQKYGGQGTITYYAPTRTLIIRNSAEVINQLGGGR